MDHSQIDYSQIERFFKGFCQFDKHLGMDLKIHGQGKVTYTLEVKEHHLTTPDGCHGGVIAAMMDAILGLTSLTQTALDENLCSTVEFKISYLSEAKLGEVLEGTGDVDFAGSSLVAVSGQIREVESGRLIAKAMGTFSQYPASKKADVLDIYMSETA